MANIPFLGMNDIDDLDKFFDQLEAGDIFTYTSAFIYGEIKKMAERRSRDVRYCHPGTDEYKAYGDMTVKVVGNKLIKGQLFYFDENMIDI